MTTANNGDQLMVNMSAPIAPFVYNTDISGSAWNYVAPDQHPTFIMDSSNCKNSSSTIPLAWGQVNPTSFVMQKTGSKVGDPYLRVVLGPLTATGGTYCRFPNFPIHAAIDTIQWMQAQNRLTEPISGDTILQKTILDNLPEDLDVFFANAAGNLSAGSRNAAAQGNQTIYVPLSPYFADNANKWVFVEPFNPDDLPRADIKFKNLANFVQTDGTNPQCNIISANVEWNVVRQIQSVIDAERMQNMAGCRYSGVEPKLISVVMKPQDLVTSNNNFVVDLSSITGNIVSFSAKVRAVDDLTANNTENILPWISYSLRSTNMTILADVDPYRMSVHRKKYITGTPANNQIVYSFSLDASESHHAYGSIWLKGLNVPSLYIKVDPTQYTAVNGYRIEFMCWVRTEIQQKGDQIVRLLI
jgi:hypothetical protein